MKKGKREKKKRKSGKTPRIKRIREKKITRIPSGITNLDKLIQGGFEKNSTNLLIGEIGSGKSIFITQFLIEGIKSGEKSLFINFEEKKDEFYVNMLELGFNLEKLEKEGKFFFLEYTPQKVKTMLEEGGGEIEAIVLNEKISRIAIDSMTSFMMLFEKELEKKEAALSLFNLIQGWNCTSLLTYGVTEKSESKILELETDSIIQLYLAPGKNRRRRYLEIIKMRGTKHSLSIHEIKISEDGITVDVKPCQEALKVLGKD